MGITISLLVVVWPSGGMLVSINEVNLRQARLVLRWVTVSRFSCWCWTFISVSNQPPSPTQPSIPLGVSKWGLAFARKVKRQYIPLADERGVCRWNCEIPWERVPYLSTLKVCSRRGAIQIHVYLYLPVFPMGISENGYGPGLLMRPEHIETKAKTETRECETKTETKKLLWDRDQDQSSQFSCIQK